MLRLGEINLYVRDLDRAAAFYGRALGFEPCERSEPEGSWIKVRRDSVTVLFFPAAAGAESCRVGQAPGMTADLLVDDFDSALETLRAAGADVEAPRTEEGGRYTLFRDLDGIQWELIAAQQSA